MQNIQSILAVAGIGMIAYVLRWQIGFFTLESVKVGWKVDAFFVVGAMLVAQRFLLS